MEISEINHIDALAAYGKDWDSLVDWNRAGATELSYPWVTNTWRYLRRGCELKVLLATEKGRLVGVAPLMVEGDRFKTIRFIAAENSNHADFVAAPDAERFPSAALGYLLDRKYEWDRIVLDYIPESSGTLTALRDLYPKSIHPDASSACPYVLTAEGWEEFVRNSRKSLIRTPKSKLRKLGDLKFYHCATYDEVSDGLDSLVRHHRARYANTATPSRFEKPEERDFLKAISPLLWEKGLLDLSILALDGRPIALFYALVSSKRYLLYLTAFDGELAAFSPGTLLQYDFFRSAFENGFSEIDFGRGVHPYKLLWTDKIAMAYKISFDKPGLRQSLRKIYGLLHSNR